jgi:hypothetical protein
LRSGFKRGRLWIEEGDRPGIGGEAPDADIQHRL